MLIKMVSTCKTSVAYFTSVRLLFCMRKHVHGIMTFMCKGSKTYSTMKFFFYFLMSTNMYFKRSCCGKPHTTTFALVRFFSSIMESHVLTNKTYTRKCFVADFTFVHFFFHKSGHTYIQTMTVSLTSIN